MLDAFFAGRRRPSMTPPATSPATISQHDSEHLMDLYSGSRPPMPRSNDSYASNRSSIAQGEARKSLLAYTDSDNYSYASSSRPVSRRSSDAGSRSDGRQQGYSSSGRHAVSRSRPANGPPGTGFLASVWALGFQRERRTTYAQSMGSSANIDDFAEEEESVVGHNGGPVRAEQLRRHGGGNEEVGSSTNGNRRDRDMDITREMAMEAEEEERGGGRERNILTTNDKGKLPEFEVPRDLDASEPKPVSVPVSVPTHQHIGQQQLGEASAAARQDVTDDDFEIVNYEDAAHELQNEKTPAEVMEVAPVTPALPIGMFEVPEIESMSLSDERPMLSRHQSKSKTDLKTGSTSPGSRRSRSLSQIRADEQELRKDEIKATLEQELKTPSPPAVPPKAEEREQRKTPSPIFVSPPDTEMPSAPQTPSKRVLRRSSVSSARSSTHGFPLDEVSLRQRPESRYSFTAPVDEANDLPADVAIPTPEPAKEEEKLAEVQHQQEEEVPSERKKSAELQGYSRALSSMILNPSKTKPVEDEEPTYDMVPEATATPEVTLTPPPLTPPPQVAREQPEPIKPDEVHPALREEEVVTPAAPAPAPEPEVAVPVAAPAAPKVDEQPVVAAPAPVVAEAPKEDIIEAESEPESEPVVAAPAPVSAPAPVPEVTPVKTEKPPSVKSTSMEKKVVSAFRRGSISRGMSMFTPKKKSKDETAAAAADTTTAAATELTPPPTPPALTTATDLDTSSLSERQKNRMSGIFSLSRKNKEKEKEKEAAASSEAAAATAAAAKMERNASAGGESALADLSKELASETASPPKPVPAPVELQRRPSLSSMTSSHQRAESSGPLSPVVEVASPKMGEDPVAVKLEAEDAAAAAATSAATAPPPPPPPPPETPKKLSLVPTSTDEDDPKRKQPLLKRPTFKNAFSSSGSNTPDKSSRRSSFFGGKKDKDLPETPFSDTASIASESSQKPKLFRKGTLRTPSFGLSKKDKDNKSILGADDGRPVTSAGSIAANDTISIASSAIPPSPAADDSPTKSKLFSNKNAMRVASLGFAGRDKDKDKDKDAKLDKGKAPETPSRPVTSAGLLAPDTASIAESTRSDKPKFMRKASMTAAVNAFSSSSSKKKAAAAATEAEANNADTPTPTSDKASVAESDKDKPKLFRKGTLRTPTFSLSKTGRSVSSSAVSVNSGKADSLGITMEEEGSATMPPTPTPAEKKEGRGASRMKGLVRASTFMGRSKKGKEKA